MEVKNLIQKYNVPGPRYTSYPTVPYWDENTFSVEGWINNLVQTYDKTNEKDGISVYIHLPFCESLCTYCGCNTRITVNHAVEKPYIERLLKEWQMYLDIFGSRPHIRELHLGGGTPTFFSPKNLEVLIRGILDTVSIHPDAEFSFEGHPANTTKEHLTTLFGLGFRRISLGIQDFDLKVQKAINRIQTYEQVEAVTKQAREIGYTSVNYDLIYGLPFQTIDGITDTIKKVNTLQPDRIAFYSYAHVPWLKPGQRSYGDKDLPVDEVKRALYETGRTLLEENGYKEIGMDHFALATDSLSIAVKNAKLHRNFMGYTVASSKLMIGLGVSSISDSWTAFAQNVKVLEEYNKHIDAGVLPVFKGHILNKKDLILRQHILNLMCQMETAWGTSEIETNLFNEILPLLEEMRKDGLISIGINRLKVTAKGRMFVRNVCMAFDARLRESQPKTRLFSAIV